MEQNHYPATKLFDCYVEPKDGGLKLPVEYTMVQDSQGQVSPELVHQPLDEQSAHSPASKSSFSSR